ncbi:MAG: hypothetical protein ACOCXG_00685 [Nanoarchaeota archaeon]
MNMTKTRQLEKGLSGDRQVDLRFGGFKITQGPITFEYWGSQEEEDEIIARTQQTMIRKGGINPFAKNLQYCEIVGDDLKYSNNSLCNIKELTRNEPMPKNYIVDKNDLLAKIEVGGRRRGDLSDYGKDLMREMGISSESSQVPQQNSRVVIAETVDTPEFNFGATYYPDVMLLLPEPSFIGGEEKKLVGQICNALPKRLGIGKAHLAYLAQGQEFGREIIKTIENLNFLSKTKETPEVRALQGALDYLSGF